MNKVEIVKGILKWIYILFLLSIIVGFISFIIYAIDEHNKICKAIDMAGNGCVVVDKKSNNHGWYTVYKDGDKYDVLYGVDTYYKYNIGDTIKRNVGVEK